MVKLNPQLFFAKQRFSTLSRLNMVYLKHQVVKTFGEKTVENT